MRRRQNFQGYHVTAMTEKYFPFSYFDLELAAFDDKSQTYDVTNSTQGLFNDMFRIMQKNLKGETILLDPNVLKPLSQKDVKE